MLSNLSFFLDQVCRDFPPFFLQRGLLLVWLLACCWNPQLLDGNIEYLNKQTFSQVQQVPRVTIFHHARETRVWFQTRARNTCILSAYSES